MTNRFKPPVGPPKILIIKPSSLGDIIHALQVLAMLYEDFPGAGIDWVVARGFHEILEDHPMIRRLWVIDKNAWKKARNAWATLGDLRTLARGLRRERYDIVIDLQGLFRSAMIGLFTGSAERVGWQSAREGARFTYKYRVGFHPEIHAVERNIQLAEFVGCRMREPSFPFPPIEISPDILRILPREYAVIAPFAATAVKSWPARNFAELVSRLPLPSVIVGGASDARLADEMAAGSNGRAISLAGKTGLRELAAIISRARFFVSADTGPMHMAAALNVPVFAIFGPTNPVRTGPYGSIHTVIRKEMPCSPCYKRRPCDDWGCMSDITPEMVLKAIENGAACPA
ncbi:MAG: lipopolysaccharide heptosyltransferase I [Syntrophobacteraceae bacterium]